MNYYHCQFIKKNGEKSVQEYLYKSEAQYKKDDHVYLAHRKHGVIASAADEDFVNDLRDQIGEENIGLILGPYEEAVDDA